MAHSCKYLKYYYVDLVVTQNLSQNIVTSTSTGYCGFWNCLLSHQHSEGGEDSKDWRFDNPTSANAPLFQHFLVIRRTNSSKNRICSVKLRMTWKLRLIVLSQVVNITTYLFRSHFLTERPSNDLCMYLFTAPFLCFGWNSHFLGHWWVNVAIICQENR